MHRLIVAVAATATLVSGLAAAPGQAAERWRVGGAIVRVPDAVGAGAVRPGSQLRVRVLRNTSSRPVSITLIRRADGTNPSSERRRIRRGSVTVALSRRAGTRYELRVAGGGQRRVARFAVVDATSPRCDQTGAVAATLTLGVAAARAGEQVPATLDNRGVGCLESGLDLEWEAQQADGSYAAVAPPGPSTLELHPVQTGERRAFTGFVWPDLAPGRYRAVVRVVSQGQVVPVASGAFTVTA